MLEQQLLTTQTRVQTLDMKIRDLLVAIDQRDEEITQGKIENG